jgi:hypothetical protein
MLRLSKHSEPFFSTLLGIVCAKNLLSLSCNRTAEYLSQSMS